MASQLFYEVADDDDDDDDDDDRHFPAVRRRVTSWSRLKMWLIVSGRHRRRRQKLIDVSAPKDPTFTFLHFPKCFRQQQQQQQPDLRHLDIDGELFDALAWP